MKKLAKPTRRKLQVLYVSDDGARVDALAEVLESRGHRVKRVSALGEILLAGECHVLVLDAGDRTSEEALHCLAEIDRMGPGIPVVLVVQHPSFAMCIRAAEGGATGVVQNAFNPRALTTAVEGAANDRSPDAPALIEHAVHYHTASCQLDEAVGDLCAFLENAGVAPPHRARIACAAAELVQNVTQHAYEETSGGAFKLSVVLRGAHVHLEIRDHGSGMDARQAHLNCVPPALPSGPDRKNRSNGKNSAEEKCSRSSSGDAHSRLPSTGLERTARLADHFVIRSGDTGTRIKLAFELTPVRSDSLEFPNAETFRPARVQALLADLQASRLCLDELPTVMTSTLRRLTGRDLVGPLAMRKV